MSFRAVLSFFDNSISQPLILLLVDLYDQNFFLFLNTKTPDSLEPLVLGTDAKATPPHWHQSSSGVWEAPLVLDACDWHPLLLLTDDTLDSPSLDTVQTSTHQ